MELDDDGLRECNGQSWHPDTGDLLALLSAAIWVEHVGVRERPGYFKYTSVATVEGAIQYGRMKSYA